MRLSAQDASFLYTETASGPMNASGIVILEGEVPFDAIRNHIASRLHLVPRYRQRLALVPFNLGHPKWVDDPDFNLDKHVLQHRLPEGSTLEDAIEAAVKLNEPLLPRDRPLWRTYSLEGVKDRTVLLQSGHHAMIDGASGMDINMVLFDLQQNAPQPEPEPWHPKPMPTPVELATEAMLETAHSLTGENPFMLAGLTSERSEMLRRASESMTRFLAEPVVTAPWNSIPVGPRRKFLWSKYSFADFRRIRSALGGTINDVVLAAVSEGVARYLKAHKEHTDGGHLRIMCPVNVRTEDDKGALGNKVSAIFPVFDATPMEMTARLGKVRWETEQIKNNREAQAMQIMMEGTPNFPPVAMAPTLLVGTPLDPTALAANFPMPVPPTFGPRPPMLGINFVCTNVPGVQTTQYFAGYPIIDQLGLLMLTGNLGFGVVITSYNQHIYINFICDRRLVPDLDLMATSVNDAFQELLTASQQSRQEASA
ncbi:MAG: WS/DGAT domain-containing protein [Gammaproteobacteria bacterium]|nr:WS/DGAT domain-containing protein [Gammaproteobacteria bacterium]MCY4198359.1 WS/DGAT domain-containing protein [Gammaproteobacteria bacterium]MCY4278612.1 WS/DGAT domain-containing protein [Gammaproteobacteria bacterium]MCY4324226.1 WS/DGAT domain-containing protein [Gammaproteobacteria bacterium]